MLIVIWRVKLKNKSNTKKLIEISGDNLLIKGIAKIVSTVCSGLDVLCCERKQHVSKSFTSLVHYSLLWKKNL